MRKYLFILFTLSFAVAVAQTPLKLGTGVFKIDCEKISGLKFYADTLSAKSAKMVEFLKSNQGEVYDIKNRSANQWFSPEWFKPDYGIFIIRVDKVVGRWYQVYVNNDKGTKLWMKADRGRQYISWPKFLGTETTGVAKRDNYNLDIKAGPGTDFKTIKKIEKADCFEVLTVKGDWMKIRTSTGLECSESKYPVKIGWIRWRINNALTIEYFLTC